MAAGRMPSIITSPIALFLFPKRCRWDSENLQHFHKWDGCCERTNLCYEVPYLSLFALLYFTRGEIKYQSSWHVSYAGNTRVWCLRYTSYEFPPSTRLRLGALRLASNDRAFFMFTKAERETIFLPSSQADPHHWGAQCVQWFHHGCIISDISYNWNIYCKYCFLLPLLKFHAHFWSQPAGSRPFWKKKCIRVKDVQQKNGANVYLVIIMNIICHSDFTCTCFLF